MQVSKAEILSALPPYRDQWLTVTGNQDVNDIIQDIVRAHNQFAPYYDSIAMQFYSGSLPEICDRLYAFCKKNIRYREESEDDQTTALPTGILHRGYGDCKHYASFCGGVLDAIGRITGDPIRWCYRFASYNPADPTPYHVFVVVFAPDGEIWIDPTPGAEGQEPVWISDKQVHAKSKAGAIGRVGAAVQATTVESATTGKQQVVSAGTALATVGVALEAVPGIGTVAGAVVAAVGGLVAAAGSLFGSSWHTSTYIRWLLQLYQYYVLGQASVTSDNKVNESYLQDAYNWFYAVLGVPLYDRNSFNYITGETGSGGTTNGRTQSERANDYLAQPIIALMAQQQAGINFPSAYTAAGLAKQLSFFTDAAQTVRTPAGGWANLPVAQYWIDQANAGNTSIVAANSATQANPTGQTSTAQGTTTTTNFFSGSTIIPGVPNWILLAGAGLVLVLYMEDEL